METVGAFTKDLITIKVNPSILMSLYLLHLSYDLDEMTPYTQRVNVPLAYEVPFDEYLTFLSIETEKDSNTSNLFLSTDAKLNREVKKVSYLMKYLKDSNPNTIKNGCFSAIPEETQSALVSLYSNFLLNMTLLQMKLVEFLRWDKNKGNYVPMIIPTLGVFEVLKNLTTIDLNYEEVESYVELKDISVTRNHTVPSNINVGSINAELAEKMFNNVKPQTLLDNYLYRGIYGYTKPRTYYSTLEERSRLLAIHKTNQTHHTNLRNAKLALEEVLRNECPEGMEESVFLTTVLQIATGDTSPPLAKQIKAGIIKSVKTKYDRLIQLSAQESKLTELTDAEAEKVDELLALDEKIRTSWLQVDSDLVEPQSKENRLLYRYPIYCYNDLICKLENKYYDKSQTLEPLEEQVLHIDKWVGYLVRLLELCDELYDREFGVFLLDFNIKQDYVDADPNDKELKYYKLDSYYQTTVLAQ